MVIEWKAPRNHYDLYDDQVFKVHPKACEIVGLVFDLLMQWWAMKCLQLKSQV